MKSVYVLNGPNLNLLGIRDPGTYGTQTLQDVETQCKTVAHQLGCALGFPKSHHEGDPVDWIHEAGQAAMQGDSIGVAPTAGAYTHTSVALADAISGIHVPTIEVHISNLHAREEFRHHSYLSPVAAGGIVGLGTYGYEADIRALAQLSKA